MMKKETKKQRKIRVGMNAATMNNYEAGHKQPSFTGSEPVNIAGRIIPPYTKVGRGTPYVNPELYGISN